MGKVRQEYLDCYFKELTQQEPGPGKTAFPYTQKDFEIAKEQMLKEVDEDNSKKNKEQAEDKIISGSVDEADDSDINNKKDSINKKTSSLNQKDIMNELMKKRDVKNLEIDILEKLKIKEKMA
jgi:hypothetical protein